MSYNVVKVTPDTDEWLEERRKSVGASEVAAVMGLSQWSTPLDIYRSKNGVDRPFDPLISLLGHEAERTLSRWLVELSGLNPELSPGFMARPNDAPFMHATPDRMWGDIPVQIKTAHEFMSHHWDEGIPDDYRVQLQAEMFVLDAPRSLLVVQIGARDVRAIWEPRDDQFINDHMVPDVREFWNRVEAGTPPRAQSVADLNVTPLTKGKAIEADDTVLRIKVDAPIQEAEPLEAIEHRAVLLSDIRAMQEEADAWKVAIGDWMGDADTVTADGVNRLTFRKQSGRRSFDRESLERDHPDIVAEYTRQGADFRVMRTAGAKEKK